MGYKQKCRYSLTASCHEGGLQVVDFAKIGCRVDWDRYRLQRGFVPVKYCLLQECKSRSVLSENWCRLGF